MLSIIGDIFRPPFIFHLLLNWILKAISSSSCTLNNLQTSNQKKSITNLIEISRGFSSLTKCCSLMPNTDLRMMQDVWIKFTKWRGPGHFVFYHVLNLPHSIYIPRNQFKDSSNIYTPSVYKYCGTFTKCRLRRSCVRCH